MTLLVALQVVFTTLGGGIQIDRLFVAVKSCEEQASWQENNSLTVYLQIVVKGSVSVLDIMDPTLKRIGRNAYGW